MERLWSMGTPLSLRREVLTVLEEEREESLARRPTVTRKPVSRPSNSSRRKKPATSTGLQEFSWGGEGPAILVSAICLIGSSRVVTITSTGELAPWLHTSF